MSLFDHPAVQEAIERVGWTLVHTVWQATLAAIALAIVLRVGRTWSASTRYLLACSTLLSVMLAASATAVVVSTVAHPSPARGGPTSVTPLRHDASPTAPTFARTSDPYAVRRLALRALPWCVSGWALGVLCLGVAQVCGWNWLRRVRIGSTPADGRWQSRLEALAARLSVGRNVLLAVHQRIDVPIVVGVLRPMILAPVSMLNELSVGHVEAILAHELAHVRRNDYLANLIESAIETLFFYHPAVWWISKQVRRERECACDEIAATACNDRTEYARALAELESRLAARRAMRFALGAAGSDRAELLTRVRRVLGVATRGSRDGERSWVVVVAVLLSISLLSVRDDRPRTARADVPPATRPVTTRPSGLRPFRVVVGPSRLYAQGAIPATWESIRQTLGALPAEERHKVYIEIAAASESLSVARFAEAQGSAFAIVRELELAYVSNVGVDDSISEDGPGEYYVGGLVERAGVYSLTARSITVKQALISAGVQPNGYLTLARRGEREGETIWVLRDVMVKGLLDGRVRDVKIHNDDQLIVADKPHELGEASAPATRGAGDAGPATRVGPHEFHITVGNLGIYLNGKRINEVELIKALDAIPPDQRRSTYLSVSVASRDVSVQRFLEGQGLANTLVQSCGLAYVSVAGIENPPLREDGGAVGEYYVGGDAIKRVGVYSLTNRAITVKQAVISAGLGTRDGYITLFRRAGDDKSEEVVMSNVALQEIWDGKAKDVVLRPNDILTCNLKPTPTTQSTTQP